MDKFLEHYECYLTPLTPIHIGCGEDFEPTNYSIIDNVLYHFEPSKLKLSAGKREELLSYANDEDNSGLPKIQQFFMGEQNQIRNIAHYFVEVSPQIATEWSKKIGEKDQKEADGNNVYSKLAIYRASYLSDKKIPYVPASSFKGAMATALLDNKHKNDKPSPHSEGYENESAEWSKKYLGEFENSLLRLIKFGDFMPQNYLDSRVCYAVNIKKIPKEAGKIVAQGIPYRCEVIKAGQYQALKSELSLWVSKNENVQALLPKTATLAEIISAMNLYYCHIFEQELDFLLSNRLVEKGQFDTLSNLVRQIKTSTNTALVRLGKTGADSKTYSAKGVARIEIKLDDKGNTATKEESTTIWLAGDGNKQTHNLLPFGWALLEVKSGDFAENELLKKWCEIQPHSGFNKAEILARRDEKIAQQKQAEREKAAKAEAERLEQERKAQALANANENQKLVLELVAEFDSSLERQQDINSPLLKKINGLFEQALNWDEADKTCLLEAFTLEKVKSRIEFKRKDGEKNFKKQINKLAN